MCCSNCSEAARLSELSVVDCAGVCVSPSKEFKSFAAVSGSLSESLLSWDESLAFVSTSGLLAASGLSTIASTNSWGEGLTCRTSSYCPKKLSSVSSTTAFIFAMRLAMLSKAGACEALPAVASVGLARSLSGARLLSLTVFPSVTPDTSEVSALEVMEIR